MARDDGARRTGQRVTSADRSDRDRCTRTPLRARSVESPTLEVRLLTVDDVSRSPQRLAPGSGRLLTPSPPGPHPPAPTAPVPPAPAWWLGGGGWVLFLPLTV